MHDIVGIGSAPRIRVLQALENDCAERSAREAYTIRPVWGKDIDWCGQMVAEDKAIEINENHVRKGSLLCVAIHTTLHEGRHAYQYSVLEGKTFHKNREQVELWRVNKQVYVPLSENSYLVYRWQPIERDADAYAIREFKRIYIGLEQKHGQVNAYRHYIQLLDKDLKAIAAEASRTFGEDFLTKIDKALQQAYQKERTAWEKKAYRISVEFDGFDARSKTVDLEPSADIKDLKIQLKQLVREFAFQEAAKLKVDIDPSKTILGFEPLDHEETRSHFKQMRLSGQKGC